MRRRRHLSFGPSLVISAFVNIGIFAVLRPIGITEGSGYQVHRLSRLEVHEAIPVPTAPVTPVTTPPAAMPTVKPPTPVTKPVPTLKVAKAVGRPGTRGGGTPAGVVSPKWQPGSGSSVAPTGGDGSRAVPTIRRAGDGSPLTATPFEPGLPNLAATIPMIGGPSGLNQPPRAGIDMFRPGPPVINPGTGDRGGTPTAPTLGTNPLPGTAGSGDRPNELAPRTAAGFSAPLAPTTPGLLLRPKAEMGLPNLPSATYTIPGMPVDPLGHSGGGGGTAVTPGLGGGGPLALAGAGRDTSLGGGGSGMAIGGPTPGGMAIGAGPGGTGGGGTGFAPVGGGSGVPGGSLLSLNPASLSGSPSVLAQVGRGDGNGPAVRPGARAPGPGGAPVDVDPGTATGNTASGLPGGPGGGKGPGSGGGGNGGNGGNGNGGDGSAAATKRGGGDGGTTGVIVDTLGLKWPHYPTSYDLVVGSANGRRIATIGVINYRSVSSAKAADQIHRDGRVDALVIRPIGIEFVLKEGQGARQKVIISDSDAAELRKSGLLSQPSRILTVWKGNIKSD